MQLPRAFIDKMHKLLGEEAPAFFESYREDKATGLRVNPLKTSLGDFLNRFPRQLEPIPFCPTGFYTNPAMEPGKHPFHQAGLYYIQEPSAMFIAEVVGAKPQEKILDLSAAPGGKSTQLAGMMDNTGLLVANDIHPKRARVLSENIERMGITNALVMNETPERLAERFPGYFDKVLVDAPCSGEGMFRKDPEAAHYWSDEHVEQCAVRQRDILESAVAMVKSGGTLIYSTCTFSPEENEQTIEAFLDKHPDMEILPIEQPAGITGGVPEWTKHGNKHVANAARLWPHRLRGEGHFVAKLRKTGEIPLWNGKNARSNIKAAQLKDFHLFEKNVLNISINGPIFTRNKQLYSLPDDCPDFNGLKIFRPGLHLGEQKKNRFEPNHALAMALKAENVKQTFDLPVEDDRWKSYLRGETLTTGQDRGWMVVTIEGFPLGWGKEAKGTLKNFYPKGLRIP